MHLLTVRVERVGFGKQRQSRWLYRLHPHLHRLDAHTPNVLRLSVTSVHCPLRISVLMYAHCTVFPILGPRQGQHGFHTVRRVHGVHGENPGDWLG